MEGKSGCLLGEFVVLGSTTGAQAIMGESPETVCPPKPELPDPVGVRLNSNYADDEDGGLDFLERQVLARKTNASTTVSKLLCDEVDVRLFDIQRADAQLRQIAQPKIR